MNLRPAVAELVDLGRFPRSVDADEHDIDARGSLLLSIKPPLTRTEALALLTCFGPDDCFGLSAILVRLIETTPGGAPIGSPPGPQENEWIRELWNRAHR